MLTRVSQTGGIDYSQLAATNRPSLETWDTFVRDALVERWLVLYEQVSDWSTQVLEIPQGDLTFLFDAGPTLSENRLGKGEDRVVAAWGTLSARQASGIADDWPGFCRPPAVVGRKARSRPFHRARRRRGHGS